MKSSCLLDRCRAYDDDARQLKSERMRREKILALGDDPELASEIEAIRAQEKQRKREYKVELMAVTTMLDGLPVMRAQAMHFYYIGAMSYTNVAVKMGYTVGSIKRTIATGRQKLARYTHAQLIHMVPDWYAELYARGGEKG